MKRCDWAGPEQIYIDYHDTDWGVPEYDSRALWEKLILDGFQAGLSWITILKKRENLPDLTLTLSPTGAKQMSKGYLKTPALSGIAVKSKPPSPTRVSGKTLNEEKVLIPIFGIL